MFYDVMEFGKFTIIIYSGFFKNVLYNIRWVKAGYNREQKTIKNFNVL